MNLNSQKFALEGLKPIETFRRHSAFSPARLDRLQINEPAEGALDCNPCLV